VAKVKPRTTPNLSFLKLVRVLGKDPAERTQDEALFFDDYWSRLIQFADGLQRMCEEGRSDALFLQLERSRYESARLKDGSHIDPSRCVVIPNWLADCLRNFMAAQWLRGTPGVRGKHAKTDARLRDYYIHFFRYSVVEDCRTEGISLLDARLEAPSRKPGLGSTSDFERSHKLVTRKLKSNPDDLFMVLLFASTMAANLMAEGRW